MRYLSLVLFVFGISCGSIQTRIDEALTSTKELAADIKKTSATLREDLLPSLKTSAKATELATDQIRATTLEIQRVVVNLDPRIEKITTSLVEALNEVKALAADARDLKIQLEAEIDKASDIRQELEGHGNTLNVGMWVAIVLGGVLIILLVVIIHHKLTAPKRHSKQLGNLLENGGADKILKALQPKSRKRPAKKKSE